MNKIDFFKAILLTNKDFDVATINKYIEYFINQIDCNIDLSDFFLKEQHEVAELFDQFDFFDGELEYQSEYYGNTPYQIECDYDENGTIKESIIKTEEEKIIFTVKDLEIIPFNDKSYTPFYKGIAICKNTKDKYGLISKYGELLLEPIFDCINEFSHGEYLIFEEKKKYGIIDIYGKIVINPIYDYIINQDDIYFGTKEGQIYGYVNDYLIVKLNGRFGLLNKVLSQIVPCSYKGIYAVEHEYSMHTGLSYFILENEHDKFALFVPSKKILTNFDWDEVYWGAYRDILPFRRDNKYGFYFLKNGKENIMDFPFELDSFVEGKFNHIKHKEIDKYALFDENFNQLTRFEFDTPVSFTINNEVYIFAEKDKPFGIKTVMSAIEFFKKFGK